jgi:hypothetical protein
LVWNAPRSFDVKNVLKKLDSSRNAKIAGFGLSRYQHVQRLIRRLNLLYRRGFRHPNVANLVLVAVSLGVALLGAEGIFRLALPQIFDVHPQGMYVADSAVGYVLTPGFTGSLARPEFRHTISINQAGLRGAELRPRRPNSFRIVCLGDSLTWGFGVIEGNTFAAKLEAALASKFPERDIQVLNAGVPGYGTADELNFLESRAAALEPDLVIVQFLPENDFIENQIPAQSGAEVRDGWLVAKSGTAEFSSFQPLWIRMKNWLKAHSHLGSFVIERLGYLAMRVGLLGHIAATRGEDFTEADEQRAVELLGKLSIVAERLGAPSVFLFSTGQAAVISETPPPMRAVAVVERAAREAKAGFIDLTPRLRARPNRLKLYYTVDGHWTSEGHAAVAEIVTEYVVAENFLGVKSLAH